MTSYTPCFRREAGSYGAHVKGLNRVHQFDKVEIVRVEKPERSYEALQEMVAHVARLMESLELPYRILRLCGGDMGFASAMTYDFEVWRARPPALEDSASKPPPPSSSPPPSHTACSSSRDAPTSRRTAAHRRAVAHRESSTSGPSGLSFAARTRGLASPPVCLGRASRAAAASEPSAN